MVVKTKTFATTSGGKMSPVLLRVLLALLLVLVISRNADGEGDELGKQWCIADEQAPDDVLLGALTWACGEGGSDCSKIQEGQPCYYPNTLKDHASYAFNSYYQKSKTAEGSCYFHGAGMLDESDPSHDSCRFEYVPRI